MPRESPALIPGFRSEQNVYAPRPGQYVKPASKVTRAGRNRDVAAYQRAYPEAPRSIALRETARSRRLGLNPQSVQYGQATEQQRELSEAYQSESLQRLQRAERRRFIAQSSFRVITFHDDPSTAVRETNILDVPTSHYSAADRRQAAKHYVYVGWFLKGGSRKRSAQDYAEIIKSYEGKGITDRVTGQFIPFEYDMRRIEDLARRRVGEPEFMPEDFYIEMSAAA